MKFKVKLRLIDSSGKKHKYSLNLEEGSKFTLGRGTPGIGAELNHPTVSTAHCHLTIKDSVLHVMDNKSRNGTKLNGKAVQSAAVRVGDMLQVGVCQIEFLEAPNPPIEENPARTTFIDVNELSPEEARAMGRSVPEPAAPEPTMAMSRQSLSEALGQSAPLPEERTASVPSMDESQSMVESAFRQATQSSIPVPQSQSEEASRTNLEPTPAASSAPPAPVSAPDKNLFEGTMSAYAAPTNPYAAPALPDRPGGDQPLPDQGLRSLDSFGRGREGEYRREDDPRYNPDARNRRSRPAEEEPPRPSKSKRERERERETTDTGETPRGKKTARSKSEFDSHGLISTLITLFSTAAAGSVVSFQKGTYNPVVTLASGVVGTLLIGTLAWILRKQNEFMEAEGETRDYYRFLAYSTVALIPASALTSSAIIFRLAAFIVLGVAFFHFFMSKFRPVAEKFVFLVGSYVSVIAFAGYMLGAQLGGGLVGPQRPDKHPKIAKSQDDDENRAPADENDDTPAPEPSVTAPPSPQAPQQPQQQAQQQPPPQQPVQQPTQPPVQQPDQTAQQQPQIENPKDKNTKPGPDSFAISQLYKAAERGDIEIVRKLVQDKGVNPNTVAENGVTALMLAAYYGHAETAKYLLSQSADINLKDRQGTTALMWAVLKGNRDMVVLLVKSGATLNARRNDGDTALDIARLWHYDDVVRLLEDPEHAKRANDSRPSTRKPSSTHGKSKKSSSRTKSSKTSKKKKYSATEDDDN